MARRKHRSYARGMTLPIAPIAGLAAGMVRPAQELLHGNVNSAVDWLAWNYTGLRSVSAGTPIFDMNGLKNGLLPLVVGLMVHKFVGGKPLNANRALAQAGVPIIRI